MASDDCLEEGNEAITIAWRKKKVKYVEMKQNMNINDNIAIIVSLDGFHIPKFIVRESIRIRIVKNGLRIIEIWSNKGTASNMKEIS